MIATLLAAPLMVGAVLSTTPQAVSAESLADGRCMAAFIALSEKPQGEDKAAMEASMMFFMGKIVGRAGKAALGAAVGAGAATLKEAETQDVAKKCAEEIGAASDAM